MRRYILPLALAGALLSTGCGPASNNDNNSVEKCIQGRTLDCTCPDGSMGTQTCNASGTFDACMCEATNNTSANNTSANNTSVNNTSVNNTSANNTSVSSGWDVVIDDYKSIANKTDYLWVIDNSFSMCQEQDALRKNLDAFVAGLVEGEVDFHIGLTTTHAPESGFSIEPLAKEAHLQSTPQPVPGNNQECLTASDGSYAPIQKALEDAKRCLTNPEEGVKYEWNDEQIACALSSSNAQQSSGCLSKTRLEDRNGDSTIDLFDLFPDSSSYRPIPKVLRAQDYRDAQGNIEKDRLLEDLFCISVVGTRGDGYEKGLRAAVKAVSPDFTGGIPGAADADPSKPNHGFIRQDAAFSLMFMTDENDCSHDGSIEELRNTCGGNICEYFNSTQASLENNPLLTPEDLANELRGNLAATKGLDAVPDEMIQVNSIHGTWNRFDQPIPDCEGGEKAEVDSICRSSEFGEVYSGDRYERFMRNFPNHYPNTVTSANPEDRLDFSKTEPLGLMCEADTLDSTIEAIGAIHAGCIPVETFGACSSESDCKDNSQAQKTCTSGACTSNLELTLAMEDGSALSPELEEKYCAPETTGLPGENTCVISPDLYTFKSCAGGDDVRATWRNGIGLEDDDAERAKIKWMKRQ